MKKTDNEQVNHPAHYNIPGRKECIDEMVDKWGRSLVSMWCEMTAYKYEYRAGLKNDNSEEQDLRKRQWYLDKAEHLKEAAENKARAFFNDVDNKMDSYNENKAYNANDAVEFIKEKSNRVAHDNGGFLDECKKAEE